ncbi:alpha/beta fold hydrolase [Halomonas sp. TRM85114]|uniref:alpha/beta fold hydrolase n=1 Tax=Halomonas jincaotanensis TaxID=2810616 RepID=UPI001BD1CF44|nr:alpha/beta hydrolase [Halomonas jincaotanensis]MBS9404385.1 alpha/beta fold hydrolase [Halomonas jincaotanensis]
MTDPHSLRLADGRLAALSWGEATAPTWLALHGWLDNAASFTRLAPPLVERLGIRVVAIDFAGHGLSQPLGGDTDYALWDYCHDLLDACDALQIERATLLAHSLGAGVSCLVAAALPERVARLMLIDGVGVLTTPADEAHQQLRKGLLGHRRSRSLAPRYPDSETAISARVAGGVTPIDPRTAEPVVRRNLARDEGGGLRLRTDGRLLRPSPVRFCPEQALAMLAAIRCQVLLIEGEDGILGERDMARRARAAVPGLERRVLPGGHHLHLEPDAVGGVVDTLVAWQPIL